jgi:hypothetical protein
LASVIEPGRDETVLATARARVVIEGRDDVALAWSRVEAEPARASRTSESPTPDAAGPRLILSESAPQEPRRTREELTIDLAELGDRSGQKFEPGDELRVSVVVQDVLGQRGLAQRDPARSAVRRLRVISEAQFAEQLQAELQAVRAAAIRASQEQSAVQQRLRETGDAPAAGEAQERLTERLAPPKDLLESLARRVEQNDPSDRTIDGLLREARDQASRALEASQRATDALRSAQPESKAGAEADQREVRDAADRLAELLDRGRDGWAARRSIERLLDDQRSVRERTQELSREAAGRSAQELSPEQLTRLERLAEEQRELSARAAGAIEDAERRAQALRQNDPGQSRSLREAAERAREERLGESQRAAAEQIARNQTGQAERSQEQAQQTLEQMLRDLDRTEQRRDEALRRLAAELVGRVRELVQRQEREVELLAAGPEDLGPRIETMTALQRDALATKDQAVSQGQSDPALAGVADALDAASAFMGQAIGALRAEPADALEALRAERDSLARLRDALAQAEKARENSQQRQEQRKLEELREKYAAALAEQRAIQAGVVPLVGKELSRRERQSIRELGTRQASLRTTLGEIRSGTEGLGDAVVFELAHRRLDRSTQAAGDTLARGVADAGVQREIASTVRVLSALIESLSQMRRREDGFREAAQGGNQAGGQGGQGQEQRENSLVPPIAELRMLRMLQQDAAERTRELSDAPDAAALELAGQDQTEIADRAKQLLEKLKQQQEGGAP